MSDNNNNNNQNQKNEGKSSDRGQGVALAPPQQRIHGNEHQNSTRTGQDEDSSLFDEPGAIRVPGNHATTSTVDSDDRAATTSSQSQQTGHTVTLEATAVPFVEERNRALQYYEYCEGRLLREIEQQRGVTLEATAVPFVEERNKALQYYQYCEGSLREIEQQRGVESHPPPSAPPVAQMTNPGDHAMGSANIPAIVTRIVEGGDTDTNAVPPVATAQAPPMVVVAATVVPVSDTTAATTATSIKQGHRKNMSSGSARFFALVAKTVTGRGRATSHGSAATSTSLNSSNVSHNNTKDAKVSAAATTRPMSESRCSTRLSFSSPPPVLPARPIIWCWKETASQMPKHADKMVIGDRSDCWVRFHPARVNDAIEMVFRTQGGVGECQPMPGYKVNFTNMEQTKLVTGYKRDIRRVLLGNPNATGDSDGVASMGTGGGVAMDTMTIQPLAKRFSRSLSVGTDRSSLNKSDTSDNSSSSLPSSTGSPSNLLRRSSTGSSRSSAVLGSEANMPSPPTHRDDVIWCWRETPCRMPNHSSSMIFSQEHFWIRYPMESVVILEGAFLSGSSSCNPGTGYTVDLKSVPMIQTNDATLWQRDVLRFDNNHNNSMPQELR